ncbi:MAG: hypothetical protein HQK89_11700 [Nitrospirae bacterium]|nr:hypothetical protein [Nitrospirota bacterium]
MVNNIESGNGFNARSLKEIFGMVYHEIESAAYMISEGTSGISDLSSNVSKILELEKFLKKLSRSITIIGTLIRIETARLGKSDFNVMTDVVDSLARQILKGTEEITHSVQSASSKMLNINEGLAPCVNLCSSELGKARARVESILDELDQLDMQAKWLCERICSRSTQITPEIGEVVSAIQFHDITRQQIEHVCEAMVEIEGKFEIYPSEDEKGKIILLKWIMEVLKIQEGQLNSVLMETHKALEGINKPLLRVAELSEAQAEDASLMLDEEATGKDKIKMIGVALDALVSILSAVNEMTVSMVEATKDIGEKLEGITGQIRNIEDISDNVNIMALNAIIKASHTGDEGRGLGVLAHEISKLSANSKDRIAQGVELIKTIMDKSDDFKNTLSLNFQIQADTSGIVTQRARESIGELIKSDDYLIHTMHSISENTRHLKTEIQSVINGLTFEKIIGERINRATAEVQQLITEVTEIIPPHALDHVEYTPDLSELLMRYTMQSERKVHLSTITCPDTTADVDLWEDSGVSESTGGDKELGDNVELF